MAWPSISEMSADMIYFTKTRRTREQRNGWMQSPALLLARPCPGRASDARPEMTNTVADARGRKASIVDIN